MFKTVAILALLAIGANAQGLDNLLNKNLGTDLQNKATQIDFLVSISTAICPDALFNSFIRRLQEPGNHQEMLMKG